MAPGEGGRVTPRPNRRAAPPETAKKRLRPNGDDKGDASTQASETEVEAKARHARDDARNKYVTKWLEHSRQHGHIDAENWTIERLETTYAEAFDEVEQGILEGRNGDQVGGAPPETVNAEKDSARETFVKREMQRWRQTPNSVQDGDEMWPTERLEAMFGDSFDAAEMGIFEGHSQREW